MNDNWKQYEVIQLLKNITKAQALDLLSPNPSQHIINHPTKSPQQIVAKLKALHRIYQKQLAWLKEQGLKNILLDTQQMPIKIASKFKPNFLITPY